MSITGESGTAEDAVTAEPVADEPVSDEAAADEAPAPDDASSDDAASEDGDETATPGDAGPRRRSWFRWAVAVALVFAVAGGGLQYLASRARHTPANANRALVDAEATSVVVGDVSNGLGKIFSYTPDSTAITEQDAASILAGPAATQYRTLFAQVKQHAVAEHLTVRTHVVRAGVVRLSGRTAQLLVFLDQVIIRKDRPKGMSAAAQLSVTARLDAGHWRIIDIHAR